MEADFGHANFFVPSKTPRYIDPFQLKFSSNKKLSTGH